MIVTESGIILFFSFVFISMKVDVVYEYINIHEPPGKICSDSISSNFQVYQCILLSYFSLYSLQTNTPNNF
jgi:hypothetical protein